MKRNQTEFKPLTTEQVNELLELLSKQMKTLRKAKGYNSYETFAFEHDIPRAQYGKYEKRQDIRMSSFFKVCNAYGVTPSEFMAVLDALFRSYMKGTK